MTARPPTAIAIDAIPVHDGPGPAEWKPVRHHLGLTAFGVNAWTATAAGQVLIEEHDELEDDTGAHEELYLVTSGRARFRVGGGELDAPAGTIVAVPDPATRRSAVAESAGTTVFCVGAAAGRGFEVSPWERRRLGG